MSPHLSSLELAGLRGFISYSAAQEGGGVRFSDDEGGIA